jgi:hypothetical protein
MRHVRRIFLLAVVALGVALIGSSVQGLAAVDAQLATATKQDRLERQQRLIEVKQRPDCAPEQDRKVTTRAL